MTSPTTALPFTFQPGLKPRFKARIWVLIEVLLILSYTVKPFKHRPLVFFVPIAILCLYSLFCTHMIHLEHVANSGWGMACRLTAILLLSSTNILLSDIQHDLQPTKRAKVRQQKKNDDIREGALSRSISEEPFLTRLKWAFMDVWFNPRAINYSDEATNILPPRPSFPTRRAFVLRQLRDLVIGIFIYDVTQIVARANPYFGFPTPKVEGIQQLWRLGGFLYGVGIYLMVQFQHKIASMIFVGFGISDAEDWRPLFHSFKYAYSLRGLWGKMWHQMFRRAGLAHANYFLKKLGIPRKSTAANFFTLYVVFALTGILHHGGDAMFLQSISKAGSFQFFMLQAVGITIEDFVLKLVGSITTTKEAKANLETTKHIADADVRANDEKLPPWSVRLLGFTWVLVWLSITLPWWTDPICNNGYMREIPEFSIILGLWRGEWLPEEWQPIKE
ncbi:Acetyltransferase cdmC [Psilocybe cubensis]|uniref:Acetyltransferase cdmC n=2 Tax=Psilocybe cubensis TaxID=181762 RepID=A0ACB8HAG3_PSICU|nr:Acetyltransferase cdmC [Psilocybe cubensis]KAH9484824.1 Acetyltransferase cdmC [Psilocybe cubensis]